MSTPTISAYDAIVEASKRQQVEKKAADQMSKAIIRFVTGRAVHYGDSPEQKRNAKATSVFFSSLVRRTQYVQKWEIETAATNGKQTIYNPEFVAGLGVEELVGLIGHEALHDGLGHHARSRGLIPQRFNVAADLAINGHMLECGFKLPKDGVFPGKPFDYCGKQVGPFPPGLSTDQYYQLLSEQMGSKGGTGEDGSEEGWGPEGWGRVVQPEGGSASDAVAKQRAMQNLAAAHQEAKRIGSLPGNFDLAVEELLAPKLRWQDVVAEWVRTQAAKIDYSWRRPSRKWLAQGFYLPSLSGETIGHVLFLNDCSGSLDNASDRAKLRAEAVGCVMAASPTKVTIFHHDVPVNHVETWEPGDGPLPWHPKGGGGTDHRPAFAKIAELDEPPDMIVALTDLMSCFPDRDPGIPVLWATTMDYPVPFGKKVVMKS